MRRAVALVLAIPFTGSCDPSAREPGDTDRVTITSNWVFHLENGMTTTEPTLTGTFAAYQWTADEFAGPLIAMPVEGNQGRYTIDGIAPDEEYYLSIPEVLGTVRPSEAYLVSRARSLDVSTDAWGRRDWTPSVDGTRVVVDLTGMTPWQAGDTLAVMVPNVFDFYLETTDGLEEGATDVSELAFDWGDHPLVYSSSGDSLHVQHLKRPFVSGAGFVQVIADDFVEFLDQVNGVSTRVSGTFSPVQPTETLLVGWPASAFKSAVGVSDGPRYNSGFASLSIDPGGLGDLPIVRADVNVDEEGSIGPVEFGNPFPETMEPTRRSRLPGANPSPGPRRPA